MSVASISQSNVLSEDVLLMIFQHLDGEDLVNCAAVCRQWKDIFVAGTPWRQLFHRKVNYSRLWRKEQEKLEKIQLTLQTEQYRDVCRNLLQVKRNWCKGRFEKSVYPLDEIWGDHGILWNMTISDDYVAWKVSDFGNSEVTKCFFLDKESNEITKFTTVFGYQTLNEMEVRFANSTKPEVIVRDPKNQWTVNVGDEEENGYMYVDRQIAFGSGRLVEYSRLYSNGTERMRMWKVGNSPTLLNDRTFEDRFLQILKVDEQFTVAEIGWLTNYPADAHTFYFFSTKTLDEITCLSVQNLEWKYDRGLFYEYCGKGIIRILDVASGKHYNDVHLPFRPSSLFMDKWASSNSNVMVIGWNYKKKSAKFSYLSVYDLEAVKKANSDPGSHLLYTLQFQFHIRSFVMDETRIALIGSHYTSKHETVEKKLITVLNFANFAKRKSSDLKKNPEDNEYVKKKIIYDPFSIRSFL